MFEDAAKILELERALEIIASHAASEPGAEKIKKLSPKCDIELVNLELRRVEEMTAILESGATPPFGSIYEYSPALKIASLAGSMLSAETLVRMAGTLGCARMVKKFLEGRARGASLLADMAAAMSTFEEFEAAARHAIDETGEIRDSASPELKHIRASIGIEKRRSREVIARLMKSWGEQGLLQESIIATRDGRLTLPVKDNARHRVKGILVDQSSSGATYFVEPIETVEINNVIRRLELDEKREIERILREITALVHRDRFQISDTLNILYEVDSLFARAEYAGKYDCCKPVVSIDNNLKIVKGRHPLMLVKGMNVVPLDIEIGEDILTLVISGPNAGGKTVALKTVGLFTLMAMSGCFVPAAKGTVLPLPLEIFAVIGDDQSIAADLSTFTAHVSKLSRIVETESARKLVLIDEILSGTDPSEGSALAVSLLEKLLSEGALTLVTTHKGDLKAFAHRTEGAMNGSLEFDPATLSPTFRFRPGIPGSSYAFIVAGKAGLPEDVIERAKELRGQERGAMENLIIELQEKMSAVERESIVIAAERAKTESLRNLLEDKLKNAKNAEAKIRENASAEAERIIAEANKAVESAIQIIRESGASKEAIKDAHRIIEEAGGKMRRPTSKTTSVKRVKPSEPVVIGDSVNIEDSEIPGRVMGGPDSKGRFLIEAGDVKIWLEESKLFKLPVKKGGEKRERVKIAYTRAEVTPELDLRGLDSSQAASRLEEYLVQAADANFNTVEIIHGKGKGVLRKVVWDILSVSRLVKSYRHGEWGAGDYGVTVVEMSES